MEKTHPEIALVSSANDPYVGQLAEMLESIGPTLDQYDLKILDLGLSDKSKERLRRFQANTEFKDPGWLLPLPGQERAPDYKKVFVSKPFLPDLFPGYAGFVWIDADIWLQDASALQEYVAAASLTGAAFSFESHPLYRSIQKVRRLRLGNWVYIKGIKDYFLGKCRLMFGDKVAANIGIRPILNSGIFYMDSDSPIWNAWQNTMRAANLARHDRFAQICDQTCLQVATIQGDFDYGVLPATHNWLPRLAPPVFDASRGQLLDPMFPHGKIKVIHLVDGGHKDEFDLPQLGSGSVRTGLGYCDFLALKQRSTSREEGPAE